MRVSRFSAEDKARIVGEWLLAATADPAARQAVAAKYEISEPTLYGWASQLRRDGVLPPRPPKPASGRAGGRATIGKLKAELAAAQVMIERLKNALRIARPFIPPGTPLG